MDVRSDRVEDLSGNLLGLSMGGAITIDVDGAGYGWFTDVGSTPTGAHADLLTTVLHELGHELGYADVFDRDYTGLMASTLTLDTRRLPDTLPASTLAADRLFRDLVTRAAPGQDVDWWLEE